MGLMVWALPSVGPERAPTLREVLWGRPLTEQAPSHPRGFGGAPRGGVRLGPLEGLFLCATSKFALRNMTLGNRRTFQRHCRKTAAGQKPTSSQRFSTPPRALPPRGYAPPAAALQHCQGPRTCPAQHRAQGTRSPGEADCPRGSLAARAHHEAGAALLTGLALGRGAEGQREDHEQNAHHFGLHGGRDLLRSAPWETSSQG